MAPGEEGAGPAEDDEEAELARRETVVADLFYSWDLCRPSWGPTLPELLQSSTV